MITHLGVLKHAQVRVHAQSSGVVAIAFIELGSLVELALVGIDVGQEQIIVTLTPLLPLLQTHQHGHSYTSQIQPVCRWYWGCEALGWGSDYHWHPRRHFL